MLDLTIIRGATFFPVILTFTSDGTTPIDLTGWSVFSEACLSPNNSVEFSLNPVITSASGGEVTLSERTPAETKALTANSYTWDVVLQNPEGQRIPVDVGGTLTVSNINTKTISP